MEKAEFHKKFSLRLWNLLHFRQLTPQKLAEEAGIGIAIIYKYLEGSRAPTVEYAKKLSDYFEVTIDSLLTGDDKVTVDEVLKYLEYNRCDLLSQENIIAFKELAELIKLSKRCEDGRPEKGESDSQKVQTEG